MNPEEFLRTVYLGDRGCKSIFIDNSNCIVKFEIDLISRIRSESGNWEFYSEEDIEDGLIVFSSVKSIIFKSRGLLPNDYIASLDAKRMHDELWQFSFKINGVSDYSSEEIEIILVANGIHIETPSGEAVYT